jgi:hypothetical protein
MPHSVPFDEDWYSPATQPLHALAPGSSLKLPGLQLLGSVAPRMHDEPCGHAKHESAATPRGEERKVPTSHSVTDDAPSGHQPPASHSTQPVAFDSDWYLPAAQSMHASRPLSLAQLPGAHASGSDERARQ